MKAGRSCCVEFQKRSPDCNGAPILDWPLCEITCSAISIISELLVLCGAILCVKASYDIKEDYDNKHGAPNANAPKIFMKYFFVNTKTGEKSGEMLTMVRLYEDAPADGE